MCARARLNINSMPFPTLSHRRHCVSFQTLRGGHHFDGKLSKFIPPAHVWLVSPQRYMKWHAPKQSDYTLE